MFKRTVVAKEDIKAIECRHIIYLPPPDNRQDDYHLVKEVIHTKDKKLVNNVRFIKNFKRPIYVTKPGFRNHEQKKEWEHLDRLELMRVRQCDMLERLVKRLDLYVPSLTERLVFRSPYIYGGDVPSTSILKEEYRKRFTESPTPASVCGLDIETDVLRDSNEIIMATVSCRGKVFTAILSSFLETPRTKLNKTNEELIGLLKDMGRVHVNPLLGSYLSTKKDKHGNPEDVGLGLEESEIDIEYVIVDREIDIVLECVKKLHQWMPDWVEIWNIDYDIPVILRAIEKAGLDPADIFSDPTVPKEYRYFNYRKGPTSRVTASGVTMSLKPHQQYHTVECPASFQIVDGMQIYGSIRTGSAERQSYSLDSILTDYLAINKFRFKEDAHVREGTLEWHQFMQSNCHLNYVIYNQGDTVLLELLDNKLKDLAFSVATYSKNSEIHIFNSQPKRKCIELYFELLNPKPGKPVLITGTSSNTIKSDLDELTYPLSGWIVALSATRINLPGLRIIKELPNHPTRVYVATGDLDVKSSYPNNGASLNISKETTKAEISSIDGVDPMVGRMQGMNLLGGPTNAIEVATEVFHLPTTMELVKLFDERETS